MSPVRRIAVVGCGDISTVHLDVIAASESVELVAVCDTDVERRVRAEAATGVSGYADHRTMLHEAHPDIVHVCTPHNEHAPVAIDFLEAGVHVLLEKPLAESGEAMDRLLAAADRSTARLAVCYQNRYNPAVRRMHELIASGEAGTVSGANATVMWSRTPEYYASRPWRGRWLSGGGGLLMNQAIHTIDLLLWMLGDAVSVVGSASTRMLGDYIDVEDTADMVITHAGGAQSVFFATLANGANDPVTINVTTDQATLRLAGELTVVWNDGRTERVFEDPATGARSYWGLSHKYLIEDFYDSLDGAEQFWIDGPTARKSVDLIQSVYRQAGLPA
ncbi:MULTISPECIES: Gfo/Idh/MocA family protein [Microbacterium]|uniref:Gfo/Idh/MocA family oxidoreductase n=1 Tax=Microbacterium marmarense TaxID=3122051 RepID=A0ABU8LSG3_9MICO